MATWQELLDKGKEALDNAWDDVIKVGVPAIKGAAEDWAIETIQKSKEKTQKQMQAGFNEVVSKDTTAFGQALKDQFQQPALTYYGPWIIGGVVGLLLVGAMLRK